MSEILPNYSIQSQLAQGATSKIYLAHKRLENGALLAVVLKMLRPEFVSNPEYRKQFSDEAALTMRLVHPNIVAALDYIESEQSMCIVLEYVEAEPLSTHLKRLRDRAQQMPIKQAISIIKQILSALDYAHHLRDSAGTPLHIIHRDLSPSNILILPDGSAKICDFGLAKSHIQEAHTRIGIIKGTLAYMAPEQIENRRLDPRVDIFAVGSCSFEMLAGRPLCIEADAINIIHFIRRGIFPDLRQFRTDVPAGLAQIVSSALAPSKLKRTSSARAFLDMLSGFESTPTEPMEPQRAPTSGLSHCLGYLLCASTWLIFSRFYRGRWRCRDRFRPSTPGRAKFVPFRSPTKDASLSNT